MTNHSISGDISSHPNLVLSLDKATELSDGFMELFRFSKNDILGRDIVEILHILRVSNSACERLNSEGSAACYMFTKDLEPREVTILRYENFHGEAVYTFEEKPGSRLEEAFRYSYQLLTENIVGVAIYSAADFTLLKANQRYLKFCDNPFDKAESIVGRTIYEIQEGFRGSLAEECIQTIFITGKSEIIHELPYYDSERGVTYWDQVITPIKIDGNIKYIVANTQDVTERVLTKQQILRQEREIKLQYEKLASIVEDIPYPTAIFSMDGALDILNKSARDLLKSFGVQSGKIVDIRQLADFYDTNDRRLPEENLPPVRILRGESIVDLRVKIKLGETFYIFDINGNPICDKDGKTLFAVMCFRDVTAQVNSEEKYRFLFEYTQSGIVYHDADGTIIAMNRAAANIAGKPASDIIGTSYLEMQNYTIKLDGTMLAGVDHPAMVALRTGKPNQDTTIGLYNPIRKAYRLISINAVPLFRPGGTRPYQVFTVFDDITEQKNAEDALIKSEARLSTVLENSNDMIYSLNMQTNHYEYMSPAVEKLLGFSREEFMAMDLDTVHAMIHPDDQLIFQTALESMIETQNSAELHYRQRSKSGEYRWLSNRLSLVRDEAGRWLYRNGIVHDITEQVHNDEVIRYQASLLHNISDMVISTDENLLIKSWNKAAELTYGWSEEEAIGKRVDDILSARAHNTKFSDNIRTLIKNGQIEVNNIHTCRDGRRIDVNSKIQVIEDAGGRFVGTVGIQRDITERKKTEEMISKQNLVMSIITEVYEKSFQYDDMQALGQAYLRLIESVTSSAFGLIHEYGSDGLLHDVAKSEMEICYHDVLHKKGHITADEGNMLKALYSMLNIGKSLLVNHPSFHQPGNGMPNGHPMLSSLLCVPYIREGQTLGVVAVCNRDGGYRQEDQEILEAITPTIIEVLLRKRIEAQLQRQNAVLNRQSKLLDLSNEAIIAWGINGSIFYWNDGAQKMYGFDRKEALGRVCHDLLQTKYPKGSEDIDAILAVDSVWSGIIEQTTKDGSRVVIETNHQVMTDENGQQIVLETNRDISRRLEMEQALKESEARLRSVLENSNSLIYSYNVQTEAYEYMSPACEKVLGYTAEEFMAMGIEAAHSMIHPDDRQIFAESMTDVDEGIKSELHFRQLTKSGEYRWFSNRFFVIRDEAGQLLYRNGNIHDITEQVENDAVIRYQANLLQNISDMIISTDDNLIIKSWNKAAELKYGWTEAEAVGQNVGTLLQSEMVDATLDESLDHLIEYGMFEAEVIHTCKDGGKLNVLSTVEALKNDNGTIIGTIGIFHDITERKKMEDALRESEMCLRLAAEGAELGTYAYDFAGGQVFISDELKALWGLEPDEPVPVGEDGIFFRGLHPSDREEFLNKIIASSNPEGDGRIEIDYRILEQDNTIKWLHVKGQTTFAGEAASCRPIFAAGVVIDITKRVHAENSIKEISEELRNIIESTDDFIWSVDSEYRLVLFNSSFARFIQTRYKRQLEKGLRMADILTPENGLLWEDFYKQTASEGKYQIEMKIDRGSRVMTYSFNPVYSDSQLVEITVFGKDVTERIKSEREIIRLNASLEKRVSERTDELQKSVINLQNLSRIISHDLKEPIREIETYAKLIGKKDTVESNTLKIIHACHNMTSMIEDLSRYAMSSEHKMQKETVNIKRIVTSIYGDLKATTTNSTILQFESGLPLVCADKVLIRQAIYNLMSNAMKFSSKKKMAEITVGCVEADDHYVFAIRDNGVGFDMQYAHKLFNIFERLHTKDEFEGSGIGLAAVRNIIQRHGGRVWIESKEQMGTTVYFTLPICEKP